MALSGGAGWNSGKPAALSSRERVLERLPYRRRLSTVGGGGGLNGGRPMGRRRKAMDRSERALGVARSSGIRLSDWRRAGGRYPWRLSDG
jgi:hypothetical protein